MSDANLSQAEGDALIAVEKHRADEEWREYPTVGGGQVTVPLVSVDGRESFLLDIKRGRIDFLRGTYQNRARQVITLLRLDFGAGPHRNPDGEEVACPHVHVYREGSGAKWAVPLPVEIFGDAADVWQLLQDFMRYCNVTKPPLLSRRLFV